MHSLRPSAQIVLSVLTIAAMNWLIWVDRHSADHLGKGAESSPTTSTEGALSPTEAGLADFDPARPGKVPFIALPACGALPALLHHAGPDRGPCVSAAPLRRASLPPERTVVLRL